MVKVIEINDSQFNTIVLKSGLPVLLECASPECIICKTMADRIQEAGKDFFSKMVFLKLNVNENKRWQDFNVRVIPTILYFKNGILAARHDHFPEIEEIRRQIKLMVQSDTQAANISSEFKTALDLEEIGARFYKYVYTNVRHGKTKEKFRLIHQESLVHKELLQAKLRELTGELYSPGVTEKMEMKPQSFSLMGAVKMAIKIEEKLLSFYKRLQKDKLLPDKELFKKLVKEETVHLKELQKEMKFMQNKELFTPMDSPEFPTWLHKVFE